MKKLIAIILILAMSVMALASCDSAAPEIKGVTVNEDGTLTVTFTDGTTQKTEAPSGVTNGATGSVGNAELSFDESGNLVVTYPDGTTESLGKDALKEYTVKFVDYDGTLLGEVKTFAGLGVTAPTAPEREDYVFAGWDKDITVVTENMTVKATYTPMATYTVTFVDHDGTVLKTETVVSGKDATPPAAPTRDGYNFSGWNGDYTAIKGNTEIRAEYTAKGSYTVTFMDFNGVQLGKVTVQEGGTATAPATPTRDGFTFTGWSSTLSNITANKTVKAQYKPNTNGNTLVVDYTISGSTVTLTLSLDGTICLAGIEGELSFTGMTATAVTIQSANMTANLKSGKVAMSYSSASNVTKRETLLTVTLTKNADTASVNVNIADCFDEKFDTVSYSVVGTSLKFK